MSGPPYNLRADNAGHEPRVGDYVAYNYGGQLATGFITSTGTRPRSPIFTIRQVLPTEGHVSRLRGGPKCLLVLDPAEAP